jgi:putative ABC transport system permease protein
VYVSANTFDVLRVQPTLGRAFVTEDDRLDANAVALLAHHIWTSRFGADPSIVGRPVRINGAPVTVIGVMPPNFEFPLRADIWQPLALLPGFDPIDRNARRVDGVARLADGVTLEEASVEMQGVAAAIAARHPQTNQHIGVRTVPFTHAFVAAPPEAREPLIMMIGAALVLLIACANGAGLLLARANRRAREMAMRATLGASRRRIVRHLLFEALLMSAAAAVLGVALSIFAVRLFAREVTDLNLPFWIAFEFDARVFVYVAVACLGAAIASGLVPALQLARSDPQDILKDGGRGIIGGRKGQRWSSVLLVSELAVTFILLSAGGLLLRSSATLSDDDARLALDRVFTARVAVPASQYASLEQRRAWHRTLHEQLGGLPAISGATLSSARPFMDATSWELRLDETAGSDRLPVVQAIGVDHRYFETLQLPLLQGRPLTAGDARPGHLAVVVNQRFVQTHFSGESPLGRRIQLAEAGRKATPQIAWFTVVGVAPDVRQRPLSRPAPLVYMPLDAHMWSTLALTYRGVADAEATDLVREAVRAVDPDTAVFNVSSLRRLSENSRWTATFVSLVISVFAAIALALSAAGLYGITAYGLAQRTAEIGLRVAIGAGKRHVVWTLLRRTVIAAGIAMAVGAAGAWSVGQIIRAALVQSAAPDLALLLRVFGIVMVVITAACAVPMWRALHVHPIDALRHE